MSPTGLPGADPFGTQALREQVLAGWAASLSRFREDANAEDDYALGGYHDRLVVELAQNAADAAVQAGVPGRLSLRLRDNVLSAANTGAPLDAAGVEALSTLRASAKRDGEEVGRFGVGFAAVLALSDQPALLSTSGGVGWSRERTRAVAVALPGLADEVGRRGGSVPVLRLPFEVEGSPAPGFDSEVRLPLRDGTARDLAVRLLAAVDPTLLLTLPALARIEVDIDGVQRTLVASLDDDGDTVVLDDGAATRWRIVRRSGRLPAELLADRPVEERRRTLWSVLWAANVEDGRLLPLPVRVPAVVRAPTITDEELGLPALVSATLPLDPTRRHVAAGPLRDAVLGHAAIAYTELVRSLPVDASVLALVPVGLAAGAVDGVLRDLLARSLPETAFLPAAVDAGVRLRPRDAVVLDTAGDALVEVLAEVVPGLLPAAWSVRRWSPALETLGVRRLRLADVVDALSGLRRESAWWYALYAALAEAVPAGRDRDELAALPVPLADGRLVTGARGLVIAGADPLPAGLERLGVRVVDAAVAHPLLLALGAVPATPRDLLDDERLRTAVEDSLDDDDPDELAEVVLSLLAAAHVGAGELPWLGRLALSDDEGELVPAEELLLPGGAWAAMVASDAPFGVVSAALVERWGAETLVAAGVLDVFAVVDDTDVAVDPDVSDHELDAEDLWLDAVLDRLPETDLPPTMVELAAVRDLELVRDDAWPDALALLASPAFRQRVVEPAWVLMPDGKRVAVPSYTAWWVSRHVRLGGVPLGLLRLPAAADLAGLLDPVGIDLDEKFLKAIGVRGSLHELLADPRGADDLLTRLGAASLAVVARVYAAIARHGGPATPPDRLPARVDGELVLVDAQDVVVVDQPDLLPLLGSRPILPVDTASAADLADALDVALASELGDFAVLGQPLDGRPWADVPGVQRALQRAGVVEPPAAQVLAYETLLVRDADGLPVEVAWRSIGGVDHVRSGDPSALGRALAWRTNQWPARAAMTEALLAGDDDAAGGLLDGEDVV